MKLPLLSLILLSVHTWQVPELLGINLILAMLLHWNKTPLHCTEYIPHIIPTCYLQPGFLHHEKCYLIQSHNPARPRDKTTNLFGNVEAKNTEIGRTDKIRKIMEYTDLLVVKECKLDEVIWTSAIRLLSCMEFIPSKSHKY